KRFLIWLYSPGNKYLMSSHISKASAFIGVYFYLSIYLVVSMFYLVSCFLTGHGIISNAYCICFVTAYKSTFYPFPIKKSTDPHNTLIFLFYFINKCYVIIYLDYQLTRCVLTAILIVIEIHPIMIMMITRRSVVAKAVRYKPEVRGFES
ncbi:hypothetical protein L9F63_002512, partial [Diploptera punctata]